MAMIGSSKAAALAVGAAAVFLVGGCGDRGGETPASSAGQVVLPSDFPSAVKLVEGALVSATSQDVDGTTVFLVTVQPSDPETGFDGAIAALAGAGFTEEFRTEPGSVEQTATYGGHGLVVRVTTQATSAIVGAVQYSISAL